MTGELEILEYTAGGGFAVFLFFMFLAFTSPYSRAKIFRLFSKNYAVAELDQDSTNMGVKVIKTTDEYVKFAEKAYRVIPSKFKMMDGLPVIRFHYMSTEPASLRPYDAIQFVNLMPTGIEGIATVSKPGAKKGETITEDIPFSTENMKINVLGWKEQAGPLRKFEHISTPNELGGYLIYKEAEMEAKSLLMKVQAIQNLLIIVLIVAILAAGAAGLGYANYDKLGNMQAKQEYQGVQLSSLQDNLTTFRNMFSNSTVSYQPIQQQPGIVPVK